MMKRTPTELLEQLCRGPEPRAESAVRRLQAIEVRHTQDSPVLFMRIRRIAVHPLIKESCRHE
jgi:hypothetical protein